MSLISVRLILELVWPRKSSKEHCRLRSEGADLANKTLFCRVYYSMACAHTFRVIYELVHVPVTRRAFTMMTIVMRLS